jgi:hypothetical protein
MLTLEAYDLKWTSHAAYVGEKGNTCNILVGTPEERDNLGDPDIEGNITLKFVIKE